MEDKRRNTPPIEPVLSLRGICKTFEGVEALKSVDLDLYPGEILGLVGDNGAGKSTLIKVLSGVHQPDKGELHVSGRKVEFKKYDVRRARRMGIETVHQDRSLGEKQSLWRNVFVGRPIANRFGFINVKEQKRAAMEILSRHVGLRGKGVGADALVRNLSGGERQGLAIGRAMYFDSRIVVLDEPTTALSLKEVEKVLSFVRGFVGKDKACIYISHNMNHVHRVAHRVIVMDRGQIAGEHFRDELSLEVLEAKVSLAAATERGMN